VALALSARAATPVSVRVAGLAPGQACQLTRAGNAWTLRPDRTGALRADGKGVVTFRATAPAVSIPPVSRTVEGLFRGGTSRAGEVLAYPDAGGRTAFMTGEKTAIRRGEAGAGPRPAKLSDLQRGDRITARIGPDGVATDITATTSMAEGAVASFTPMMPYAMPAITLSGGPARVIDLSAPLHLDGKDVVLRTQPVGYAPIAPGERVRLRFDPVTGRVFELWKPAP
jgi:hypothetical protein